MTMIRTLGLLACVAAVCSVACAQSENVIHIRLLDGKTGKPVEASNYLVKVDHHDTVHNEWVKIGDDGSVTVTLPTDAQEISVKATYGMGMDTYINCDAAKQKDKERDIWYPISVILRSGAVAPDECGKTEYTAKPGEFLFFVRERDWRDKLND